MTGWLLAEFMEFVCCFTVQSSDDVHVYELGHPQECRLCNGCVFWQCVGVAPDQIGMCKLVDTTDLLASAQFDYWGWIFTNLWFYVYKQMPTMIESNKLNRPSLYRKQNRLNWSEHGM